ncbi:23S rRNA (pseudouridine(1915)-N(3))-methyltransferase RlmH [Patescibacteria group bacterium]|nr:23S rRNA (pseudouridine(1915)-N(3))-methyltransferase RlmH [Patescibacteria group bacterium]
MLHIQIIQIGKTKDLYFIEAENEYRKRLGRYAKVESITLDAKKTGDDPAKLIQAEGELILGKISADHFVIAMEIKGQQYSSEDFAKLLNKISLKGKATFIIGGPYGLSTEVLARADLKLSFSKMTFTHQMIRTILLEQIYRAFTILEGKSYHY